MPLCPIHKTQLLKTNDEILQNNNGSYRIPVFFCKMCAKYYAIGLDYEHRPGLVKKYKSASIMYVSIFEQVKKVESRNVIKASVKNKKENRKKR